MDVERIWSLARGTESAVLAARRHIHQYPELSFHEEKTSAFIAERLDALGYEPRTNLGGFGVKAVLHGARPGRTVGLRADMDALPLREEAGLPFASTQPGVMHACGHDAHTAMLLGAAAALREVREELTGNVVFLFQPAEELLPGGAKAMIDAGAMVDPDIDCIFGLHESPMLDTGTLAITPGPRQASADIFVITISGPGGHAAAPHRTADVIAAAGQAITAIHQIASRQVSPTQPVVITIGTVHGGTKENIIPETVTMTGTVRAFDEELRGEIRARLQTMADAAAAMFGARAQVDYTFGYPVLVNEPSMTEVARRAATRILGAESVLHTEPSMPAEDFAYFLQRVPGAFGSLGVGAPGSTRVPPHSPGFVLDEAALPVGVAYYIALVSELLGTH